MSGAERPNTVIQPDPETGQLREMTQKEMAEAAGRYATTLRPGSAERAEIERQAISGAEFGRLAADVARELGQLRSETWEVRPGYRDTQRKLTGPDGAAVYFSALIHTPGRAEANGNYPRTNASAKGARFSCSVAIDRGAAAIARDIARKVLPGYLAALGEIIKYNETEQANHETRGEAMAEMAGMLGLTFRQPDYEPGANDTYTDRLSLYNLPGRVSGSVEASGVADVVNLRADYVPAETARKMLAVLAADVLPAAA